MKKTKVGIGASVEMISMVAIVRAGPVHRKVGDPFDFAVVVVGKDGKGIVKALVKSDADFDKAYFKAGIKAIRSMGLKPDWIRMVPGRPVQKHKLQKRRALTAKSKSRTSKPSI